MAEIFGENPEEVGMKAAQPVSSRRENLLEPVAKILRSEKNTKIRLVYSVQPQKAVVLFFLTAVGSNFSDN